jgi:hypothetical protein
MRRRNADELGELPVNKMEKDCEAQDQGYEFHFSWLLVLIAFVAWKMLEGAMFQKSSHQSHWPQGSPPCGT